MFSKKYVRNLRSFFICLLISISVPSYAGDITYTGRATVIKDDIKTAQKNALKNALIGGLKLYLAQNTPHRKSDITEDYLVFIDDYILKERSYENGVVSVKVDIDINDLILEDIAVYVAKQVNTATFLYYGLPDYLSRTNLRKVLSDVFYEKQFSTKEQIHFEQELIDINNKSDVQTAFQSITAQYLFLFNFHINAYKSGEYCHVKSESYYISADKVYVTEPILKSEVTIESQDANECIMLAVSSLVETALSHVRLKQIPSPGKQLEVYKYNLVFAGINNLKNVNDIIGSIQKRKLILSSSLEEFQEDSTTYVVDCYLTSEDLAKRINSVVSPDIKITYSKDTITLDLSELR